MYKVSHQTSIQENIEAQIVTNTMKKDTYKNNSQNCTNTFEDFIEGFEKQDECTSASTSGQHLGIYKALSIAMNNKNKFQKQNKKKKSHQIKQK